MLYPAELRAHASFPAGFGSFEALARQRLSGTQRKHAAQRVTLAAQSTAQPVRGLFWLKARSGAKQHSMKLTTRTRLIVEVDPDAFLKAPHSRQSLHYLLERLFSGEEVAVKELASWGINVREADGGGLVGWGDDIPPEFQR